MVKAGSLLLLAVSLIITGALEQPEPPNMLTGHVTFTGTAPAATPIDMSSEAFCVTAHEGRKAERQPVRVNAQNRLADVVVYVKGVTAGSSLAPANPVVLDQQNCLYRPSVLALRVGQPLIIRNSDNTLHNVHVRPSRNASFNLGQPVAGMEARRTFRAPEIGIPVQCDIHDWMNASIVVFDHSFFAVTGEDGRFQLDALPAGEYEIEAWHPTLGRRSQRVTIPTAAGTQLTFTFGTT
jgi:plastocyanin